MALPAFPIRSSSTIYRWWAFIIRSDSNLVSTQHKMADAAAPKVKKATKPKVPAAHPPYAAMIAAAIKGLGDKKGSSRQAILKHVVANNKVDAAKAAVRVRLALKKMIAAKKVVAAAAAGKKGAGSFKLAVVEKKAKKVKKPKAKKPKKAKKAAKKPAAKKPKAKNAPKDFQSCCLGMFESYCLGIFQSCTLDEGPWLPRKKGYFQFGCPVKRMFQHVCPEEESTALLHRRGLSSLVVKFQLGSPEEAFRTSNSLHSGCLFPRRAAEILCRKFYNFTRNLAMSSHLCRKQQKKDTLPNWKQKLQELYNGFTNKTELMKMPGSN